MWNIKARVIWNQIQACATVRPDRQVKIPSGMGTETGVERQLDSNLHDVAPLSGAFVV